MSGVMTWQNTKSLFIFLFFSFLFFSYCTYNYKMEHGKVSCDFVTMGVMDGHIISHSHSVSHD